MKKIALLILFFLGFSSELFPQSSGVIVTKGGEGFLYSSIKAKKGKVKVKRYGRSNFELDYKDVEYDFSRNDRSLRYFRYLPNKEDYYFTELVVDGEIKLLRLTEYSSATMYGANGMPMGGHPYVSARYYYIEKEDSLFELPISFKKKNSNSVVEIRKRKEILNRIFSDDQISMEKLNNEDFSASLLSIVDLINSYNVNQFEPHSDTAASDSTKLLYIRTKKDNIAQPIKVAINDMNQNQLYCW